MALQETNLKDTKGKARVDYIPWSALEGIAQAMEYGVKIHGLNNWKNSGSWRQYARATISHTYKWLAGENSDPDSKINHIYHAAASIIILCAYVSENIGDDDR